MWQRVQVTKLLTTHLFGLVFTHPPLDPNILLGTLFSSTLSLWSSVNVTQAQFQHTQNCRKIIFFYILFFVFLDRWREDKRFWAECQTAFPEFNLLLIFFIHAMLICQRSYQTLELCCLFKGSISNLYVMMMVCILVTKRQHILGRGYP
jgi:hypothetical protein